MELSTILTYLALLITAYGATQEYIRLKIKLVPKIYTILFGITLIILYLTTLDSIQEILKQIGKVNYPSGLSYILWDSKYLIILSINLVSLYMILIASKLTTKNQKQFLDLIHELRGYKNIPTLHKLIKENLETIFKIKYTSTFQEKASSYKFKKIQDLIKFDKKEKQPLFFKAKDKIFYIIYSFLAKFSYKKETINEIFQYAVSDKLIIKSIAQHNEPLGIEVLKNILKYKAFDSGFKNRFLISTFKNRDSYIYKEFITGHSGSIHDFFNENQYYEQGLDIGLNIYFAILELIEDNQEILVETYEDFELKPIFKHIKELFEALKNTDPSKSHYSNLPNITQKVILKNIDLSIEEETVGLYFLNELFSTMKELNAKCNGCYIESFNSLYSFFAYYTSKTNGVTSNTLVKIGCHYIDYLFNDRYIDHIEDHVAQFKKHIEQSYKSDKQELYIYSLVLDKRRDRGECEDHIAYTHASVNKKITQYWDEIEELIKKKL